MYDDFWKDLTEEQRKAKQKCYRCRYGWKPVTYSSVVYCDYICKTGRSRGCLITECDKFVKRTRRRRGNNDD